MGRPILIGISGKIGAGKTTTSQCIKEILAEMGYESEEVLFAASLKDIAAAMTGQDRYLFDDRAGKELYSQIWRCTLGQLLQKVGEWARSMAGPDIWIRKLFDRYDPKTCNWIISDVRYPNEADTIRDRGGFIIRIDRDLIYRSDIIGARDPEHASETAMDNYGEFRYQIANNSSKTDLIRIIREILDEEFGRKK